MTEPKKQTQQINITESVTNNITNEEEEDLDQQINNRLVSNAEKYKQGWTQYLESNLPLKNYLDTPVKGSKVTRADYLRAIYKENDNFL